MTLKEFQEFLDICRTNGVVQCKFKDVEVVIGTPLPAVETSLEMEDTQMPFAPVVGNPMEDPDLYPSGEVPYLTGKADAS